METTRRMLQQEMSYMASRGPILRRFFGEENAPTLGTLTQEFERKGVRVCVLRVRAAMLTNFLTGRRCAHLSMANLFPLSGCNPTPAEPRRVGENENQRPNNQKMPRPDVNQLVIRTNDNRPRHSEEKTRVCFEFSCSHTK